MRTDSVNVAATAQQEARAFILERIGPQYVPPTARVYKNKNVLAPEAHEAIRPTSIRRLPADTRPLLTADQAKLYELIWKRFLASQMAAAIFDVTTVEIDAVHPGVPGHRFRATGSRPRFLGFLRVYREGKDDTALREAERQPLPALAAGDNLDLLQLLPEQHFTEPPAVLHRGDARQGARGAGHRSSEHIRADPGHDPGPGIRRIGRQDAATHSPGTAGKRLPGGAFL